jgi:hypothetical protein
MLDESAFEAFEQGLNAPTENEGMVDLLSRKSPWE